MSSAFRPFRLCVATKYCGMFHILLEEENYTETKEIVEVFLRWVAEMMSEVRGLIASIYLKVQ